MEPRGFEPLSIPAETPAELQRLFLRCFFVLRSFCATSSADVLAMATRPVVSHPQASALLETSGLKPVSQHRALRGITDEVAVYEIP